MSNNNTNKNNTGNNVQNTQNIPNQNVQTPKKKNLGSKLFIIGSLATIATYNGVKTMLFGNPPKPWRKTLFYGSLATMVLYNSCNTEIDSAANSIQNKVDSWWDNSNYEGRMLAETEVEKLKQDKQNLRDSLYNIITDKNKVIVNKNSRINYLEGTLVNKVNGAKEEATNAKEEAKRVNKKFNDYVKKEKVPKKTYIPSKNIEKHISKTCDEGILWYVVKKGDMLGEVSRKLTGDMYNFQELAEFNNISNPNDVPVGFPLEIPSDLVRNYSGLRTDDMPTKFTVLNRGETVGNIVQRLNGRNDPNKVTEILNYNASKGNNIPRNGFQGVNKAIVYIK